MKPSALRSTVIAALAWSMWTAAQAHGIWFAQRGGQLALVYGVGAEDLDTVKRQPLLRGLTALDAHGQAIDARWRASGALLLVESERPPVLVATVLDNGIWSKTPDGRWHRKGHDELPDAVRSEKTIKYAVAIRGPLSGPVPALPGQVLQIVPDEPALPTVLGQTLRLRVLYEGKPVAGAVVRNDHVNDPDHPGQTTDADGRVTITVRNQGLNVVAAVLDRPSDEPARANKVEHLATLSFVLAHAPE